MTLPAIRDDSFAKNNHLPVYCCMSENYSWDDNYTGNIHVATCGTKKDRDSFKLTWLNSERKILLVIIFKDVPMASNSKINSVICQ